MVVLAAGLTACGGRLAGENSGAAGSSGGSGSSGSSGSSSGTGSGGQSSSSGSSSGATVLDAGAPDAFSCTGTTTSNGCVQTLASNVANATDLAVDETSLYWTSGEEMKTDGLVMKVALDGSGAPVTLASGQAAPDAIAVDGESVYWTNEGGSGPTGAVLKAPLGGGTPATLASSLGNPTSIAVSASQVYWIERLSDIASAPVAGGAATTLVSGQPNPKALALGPAGLYFIDRASPSLGGGVLTVSLSGGTPTVLAGDQEPIAITSGSAGVFWGALVNAEDWIYGLVPGATTPAQITRDSYNLGAIAADATNLYWTDWGGPDGGSLQRMPIAGGPITKLAPVAGQALVLVVDSTSVYWIDADATSEVGSIMRLTPK
jgi:hypothetical protein